MIGRCSGDTTSTKLSKGTSGQQDFGEATNSEVSILHSPRLPILGSYLCTAADPATPLYMSCSADVYMLAGFDLL